MIVKELPIECDDSRIWLPISIDRKVIRVSDKLFIGPNKESNIELSKDESVRLARPSEIAAICHVMYESRREEWQEFKYDILKDSYLTIPVINTWIPKRRMGGGVIITSDMGAQGLEKVINLRSLRKWERRDDGIYSSPDSRSLFIPQNRDGQKNGVQEFMGEEILRATFGMESTDLLTSALLPLSVWTPKRYSSSGVEKTLTDLYLESMNGLDCDSLGQDYYGVRLTVKKG